MCLVKSFVSEEKTKFTSKEDADHYFKKFGTVLDIIEDTEYYTAVFVRDTSIID